LGPGGNWNSILLDTTTEEQVKIAEESKWLDLKMGKYIPR